MRNALALVIAVALAGCPYMSEEQFQSYWDNDQDEWGVDEDCDDTNEYRHPFAHDFRGDGCDADCGGELDSDGDDWPDDSDCDGANPDIYPCAPEIEGDGVDSDCGGEDGVRSDGCDFADPDATEAGEPTPRLSRDCVFQANEGGTDSGM